MLFRDFFTLKIPILGPVLLCSAVATTGGTQPLSLLYSVHEFVSRYKVPLSCNGIYQWTGVPSVPCNRKPISSEKNLKKFKLMWHSLNLEKK